MGEALIIQKNIISDEELFATISVVYPSGSTCTCTCGSKVLTDANTNGTVVFAIPYAGTWTVSCTDGSQSKSQSVSITTEGQSASVELKYWDGELYITGNEYTSVTGGWKTRGLSGDGNTTSYPAKAGTVVKNSTNMVFTQPKGSSGILEVGNDIDLTNYNSISIRAKKASGGHSIAGCFVVINRSTSKWYDNRIASVAVPDDTMATVTLNISSLTGKYDLCFGAQMYSKDCVFTIEHVKLLK